MPAVFSAVSFIKSGRLVALGVPLDKRSPLRADVALIKAERADRWGNLVYRKAARNFGPVMASAVRLTVASVHGAVEPGELDPEHVVTPGIFVQRVEVVPRTVTPAAGLAA